MTSITLEQAITVVAGDVASRASAAGYLAYRGVVSPFVASLYGGIANDAQTRFAGGQGGRQSALWIACALLMTGQSAPAGTVGRECGALGAQFLDLVLADGDLTGSTESVVTGASRAADRAVHDEADHAARAASCHFVARAFAEAADASGLNADYLGRVAQLAELTATAIRDGSGTVIAMDAHPDVLAGLLGALGAQSDYATRWLEFDLAEHLVALMRA